MGHFPAVGLPGFLSIAPDALIETTPVDYLTGEPALGYLRQALE